GTTVPNPGLRPETAVHYELGYQIRQGAWGGKLAVFQSDLRDAIVPVTVLPQGSCSAPCTQQQNVGKQRNRGVELSLDYTPVSTLMLNAQANYIDVDIDNPSNPTIKPTNIPRYKYMLAGDWQFLPQWHLRIDAQHEAQRNSNSTGSRVADSFTLANAFLRFEPLREFGIEVGVRNLGDELYAYEEGYYEAGRTWLAQIDYRY
ncbi:MAG: TonB-dependent receptor, partial [Solimonas sp.]